MKKGKIFLIIYWFLMIVYFEGVYRVAIFRRLMNSILDPDFYEMVVFSLPIAALIYIVSTLFSEKTNKKINIIILSFVTFLFIAQVVYYKVYDGVFSVYSMSNGGQVLEFWRTILSVILNNVLIIGLLFVPLILYFPLKKYVFDFSKNSLMILGISVASFAFLFASTFLYVNIDKKGIYSSYNLYFNTSAPILSVKKLGLLTTMSLDLNRTLFGMAEKKVEIVIDNNNTTAPTNEDAYNTIDIDFDSLIENEDDETLTLMHQYFNSLSGTKKNEYTGMFEGKNVVFFLAESLDPIAIDKELTPTLYKLANSGFDFTNYYAPLFPASTADGEFRTEWSLISSRGDTLTLYAQRNVYSPYIFANSFSDYNINVYHDYNGDYYNRRKYFESLGYEKFTACYYGLDLPCDTFHESDLDMVNLTFDDYINSEDPFFAYYITLSGHLSYVRSTNKVADKNWSYVENLPYSDKVKGYLSANIELDKALESLIKKLEDAGKLDDTVIVITPDHYPYGLTNEQINEVSETNRDDAFELYHSDLIIWSSSMNEKVVVDKVGSNTDVLPTLLNLFGKEYDSRLIMGEDLLSDGEGLVVLANRSWITDTVKYNALTGETTVKYDNVVDDTYITKINNEVDNQFKISSLVLDNNYYKVVFNKEVSN